MQASNASWKFTSPNYAPAKYPAPTRFWAQHREATLNWLALGLLLAAWNAADNEGDDARRRPEALRGYSSISVRAATRAGASMDR